MQEKQNRFENEMNLGHTAAWDQDWGKAADHYQQALEEIPDDPKGLVSLGLALYELGSYNQSIEYYSRAMEVSPDDPLAYDKVAQLYEMREQYQEVLSPALFASELYLKQGNISKSIECLVRVIRVDPENLPAHSRLALIYERAGRKPQSVNEYLVVASLFQSNHDSEAARQAVKHALEILPNSKEAQDAQAIIDSGHSLPKPVSVELILPKINKLEESTKPATPIEPEISKLDPIAETHEVAISALANLVFEQNSNGSEPKSQEGYSTGVPVSDLSSANLSHAQSDPKMFNHIRQALDLWSQASKGAAADELERAVALGLDHPAAYYELGTVRSGEDRLESAIRYLERALNDREYALASRLLIARTLRYMDKLSEAATNYLEALRLADAQLVPEDQTSDMLHMYIPIIEAETKQTDPALKNQLCDMIEDLLVRPGWQTYLLQARGDFQIDVEGVPAIPIGELISNPQGEKIVESVRQINQYARASHWRSAMEEAFFAIQFAPTYLPLHTYMGELLLKQDNLPEAVSKFEVIAKTYHARGEEQHSVKILQRLIKAAPMDLSARIQLISLLEETGDIGQAVEEKINLAGVYYNLADISRAREVYLDAYKIAQNSGASSDLQVKILYHLADVELQSLDWKHAEEIYTQIQSLKPEDHLATEKLIDIKLRLGKDEQAENDIDEYMSFLELTGKEGFAEAYIERLAVEYPERVYIRQKNAQLYQDSGNIEKAIHEYDEIAELLLDAGDRHGAIEAIEMILTLEPPNRNEYQDLIENLKSEG
ncbi:MAG: tetratricopeptide repeat protein [Anaerolineales bacterium]|nr:tetratricopeptide repeat protein [Anaerolineales bacterium]